MNILEEIQLHAAEDDKPCLIWLFDRYHMESQWGFVARVLWRRYGVESYKVYRVWVPTTEGRVLYEHSLTKETTHEHPQL